MEATGKVGSQVSIGLKMGGQRGQRMLGMRSSTTLRIVVSHDGTEQPRAGSLASTMLIGRQNIRRSASVRGKMETELFTRDGG